MITQTKQGRSVEFLDEHGKSYIVLDDGVFYEYSHWNSILEDEYDGNDNMIDEHGSIVTFSEVNNKQRMICYSKSFLANKERGSFTQLTHRFFGPAVIVIYEDEKYSEEWRVSGRKHREDGPAEKNKTSESWYYNNAFLGCDKAGFWALWDRLDEMGRQKPNLLVYLAKYL